MSFSATTVRNTVEYSTVMVLPHSSDITVSMDAIDACGQFNVTVHSTPNFFPEIALISLAHFFGNPIRYNSFFVPFTFSESVFKATSTRFHQGKSVPIPRLTHLKPKPISIHSSIMMLFDILIPAGNTGLFNVTIILGAVSGWLHAVKEPIIESWNSEISAWWMRLLQFGSRHLNPSGTINWLSSMLVHLVYSWTWSGRRLFQCTFSLVVLPASLLVLHSGTMLFQYLYSVFTLRTRTCQL